MTALVLLTAVLLAADHCPPGARRVDAPESAEGYKCVPEDAGPPVPGQPGRPKKHKCPPGSQAVEGGMGQRARCVMGAPAPAPARQEASDLGAVPPSKGAGRAAPRRSTRYRSFAAGAEASFDVPADWDASDGWGDSPPTLYLALKSASPGKRVSIMVTRFDSRLGDPTLAAAFKRELSLPNAMDGGQGGVAGRPARFAIIPRESHTAYVDGGNGRYYTVGYSAPAAIFSEHQPAFDRLLETFRIRKGGGEGP